MVGTTNFVLGALKGLSVKRFWVNASFWPFKNELNVVYQWYVLLWTIYFILKDPPLFRKEKRNTKACGSLPLRFPSLKLFDNEESIILTIKSSRSSEFFNVIASQDHKIKSPHINSFRPRKFPKITPCN